MTYEDGFRAGIEAAAEIAREYGHDAGREYGGVTATRIESAIRARAEKETPREEIQGAVGKECVEKAKEAMK